MRESVIKVHSVIFRPYPDAKRALKRIELELDSNAQHKLRHWLIYLASLMRTTATQQVLNISSSGDQVITRWLT